MNIFSQNPIKVFVKGFDNNNELYTKSTYIFLNVPQDIYKEVIQVSKSPRKSPKLKAFFGKNWDMKLNIKFNSKAVGGQDNLPDNEIETLEELLDEDPVTDIFGVEGEEAVEVPIPQVKETTLVNYINDVFVFPEDRISEFKDKVHLVTDIPMFRQHMYLLRGNNVVPVSYRTTIDGVVSVDIRTLYEGENDSIMDIPIDARFNQSRDIIRIEAYDELRTMKDMFDISTKFYVVDLESFIAPNRKLLMEIARNDTFKYEMLYYGFILKYFPQLSPGALKDYLIDENTARSNYPQLFKAKPTLERRYELEGKIINKSYQLDKLASVEKEVNIGIRSATITVDKMRVFTQSSALSRNLELNVRNLFDVIELNNTMPIVKVRLIYNNKDVTLTKVYGKHSHKSMFNYKLLFYNTIAILLKIDEGRYAILTFYESGKYSIKITWGENSDMSFDKTFNVIEPKVNLLIKIINEFGRKVFNTRERLSEMKKMNSEFTELNINIFWRKIMVESVFNKLLSHLRDYYIAGIFQDQPGLINEFALYKGVTKFDVRRLERSITIDNYYSHLTDSKIKQRWDFVFGKGRSAIITHRSTDVRVEVLNIREQEFEIFFRYILNLFHTLTINVPSEEFVPKNVKVQVGKNRLKRLKAKDPVLYQLKDKSSGQLYSKKCQKPHQPIIYSPTEILFLPEETQKKLVKYWNFTTKTPAYYLCPDDKNPYLGFITGIHQDDFCVPCCKKADPIRAETSKKIQVYNVCMERKVYTEDDTPEGMSRYIMGYGKEVEPERLGQLPKLISDFLMFNTDIGSKARDLLRSPNFYMIGITQNAKAIENIGAIYTLAEILNTTPAKFVKTTSKFIQDNLDLFFEYRDQPLEEFADLIDGDFVSEAPWNDIAIEAVKYQHNIYTLQIDDVYGNGSSFKLNLPEKIHYVDDIIAEKFKESSRKFVIMLRRKDKTNEGEKLYYPVVIVKPREFFKNGAVEQLIYSNSDDIMNLIRTMISKLLSKPGKQSHNRIDLKIITDFVDQHNDFKFIRKYVNSNDMCYAVLIKYGFEEVYLPVAYSSYRSDDPFVCYEPFVIRKHKLKYKVLLKVVEMYNKFILSISEYQTQEGKMIPIYPLIKPKRFLAFNGTIIGFISKALYYYFTDGKKMPKYNPSLEQNKFIQLLYHPDDVNSALRKTVPTSQSPELAQALYSRYMYDLFMSHMVSYFESARNQKTRKVIKSIISKSDYQNIEELERKLRPVLSKNDFIKIRRDIQNIPGKKNFLKHFDDSTYEFDRVEYERLLELPKKDVVAELTKIANKIIVKKTPRVNDIANIIPSCSGVNKVDYCKGSKLMIPPKHFSAMINAFANDLLNPLKRDYILRYMFARNVADFAEFRRGPNETLFLEVLSK